MRNLTIVKPHLSKDAHVLYFTQRMMRELSWSWIKDKALTLYTRVAHTRLFGRRGVLVIVGVCLALLVYVGHTSGAFAQVTSPVGSINPNLQDTSGDSNALFYTGAACLAMGPAVFCVDLDCDHCEFHSVIDHKFALLYSHVFDLAPDYGCIL